MFLRCGRLLVVLALVIVIGGHWALLQSAAWIGMAVSFSQCEPVSVALQKTFDGEHPCKLCKLVKAGKASEQKRDLQKLEGKLDFNLVAGACGLFPPKPFRHFIPESERARLRAEAPLLEPPRAA